ncbi:MAG: DUF4157 domain-containing protein [Terriglobales bacterium]
MPTRTPVHGLLQRKCACGGSSGLAGECEECRKKKLLQRRVVGPAEATEVPPIVHEVLRSPGQPLDPATRAFFEPRFGHDFSRVRVHTDARAADSARAVNALAYTVGPNVVFGATQYAPTNVVGIRLLAHELTHVVQQSGGNPRVQAQAVETSDNPSEQEAERCAQEVLTGGQVSIDHRVSPAILHRARGDLVAYMGGISGPLLVLEGGKLIFSTSAVSGKPGRAEHEVGAGPIPTGTYALHPNVTHPTVTAVQAGTCGANAISSGYQEITSDDPSPCSDPRSAYCTVSCPTADDAGQMCFTPKQCWGEKRIKIEGLVRVPKPTGGFVTRSGFYIHGGNHSVTVTSGCIKVFDDATFTHIRTLRGKVPLCVGTDCPPGITTMGKAAEAVKAGAEVVAPYLGVLGELFGFE